MTNTACYTDRPSHLELRPQLRDRRLVAVARALVRLQRRGGGGAADDRVPLQLLKLAERLCFGVCVGCVCVWGGGCGCVRWGVQFTARE
jgi:hypothetical protein